MRGPGTQTGLFASGGRLRHCCSCCLRRQTSAASASKHGRPKDGERKQNCERRDPVVRPRFPDAPHESTTAAFESVERRSDGRETDHNGAASGIFDSLMVYCLSSFFGKWVPTTSSFFFAFVRARNSIRFFNLLHIISRQEFELSDFLRGPGGPVRGYISRRAVEKE